MLVIEGSDLVGKSTLAKKICNFGGGYIHRLARTMGLDVPIIPTVYRKLGLLPGNWNYFSDYVNMMSHGVVQDRFFLSETVYGPLIRGMTPLTSTMVSRLYEHLEMVGGLTLFITASDNVLETLFRERGDDFCSLEQVKKANTDFIAIAEMATQSDQSRFWQYHVTDLNDRAADNNMFTVDLMRQWIINIHKVI